jgi:hypothetical protein
VRYELKKFNSENEGRIVDALQEGENRRARKNLETRIGKAAAASALRKKKRGGTPFEVAIH